MAHFTRVLWAFRRHVPALIVIVLGLIRNLNSEQPSVVEFFCTALGGVGVLMNLVVILLNGAMPVVTTADLITEDERPHYRPIDEQTRWRFLSDWIDVGWA